MAKQSLLKEFFLFIMQEKKWWLIPLILVLLVVGALIVFAGSSPLAPFIYPLFEVTICRMAPRHVKAGPSLAHRFLSAVAEAPPRGR